MVTISLDFLAKLARGQSYSPHGSDSKYISHRLREPLPNQTLTYRRSQEASTAFPQRSPAPARNPSRWEVTGPLKAVTTSLACPLMTTQAPMDGWIFTWAQWWGSWGRSEEAWRRLRPAWSPAGSPGPLSPPLLWPLPKHHPCQASVWSLVTCGHQARPRDSQGEWGREASMVRWGCALRTRLSKIKWNWNKKPFAPRIFGFRRYSK